MTDAVRAAIDGVNAASPFNRYFGFEVLAVGEGNASLAIDARAEAINHAGTLHAGVTAGLLDTVAGYAAATVAGNVVTVGLTVNYIGAAKGVRFVANAAVIKAGSRQVFVEARLSAADKSELVLATASVILTRI